MSDDYESEIVDPIGPSYNPDSPEEFIPEEEEEEGFEGNIKLMTAAVETSEGCPPATLDIAINLKNREGAIKTAGYGPMNPALPNNAFWQAKADLWSVPVEEAKTSRCGNCAVFIKTPKMLDCIASGLGNEAGNDAWGSIEAGDLGYCEAFDFKCAASRTCRAWVSGGPVTSSAYESGDGDIAIVDNIFVEKPFEGDINDLIASRMKDIMEVAEEDPNADSYEESEMEDL